VATEMMALAELFFPFLPRRRLIQTKKLKSASRRLLYTAGSTGPIFVLFYGYHRANASESGYSYALITKSVLTKDETFNTFFFGIRDLSHP